MIYGIIDYKYNIGVFLCEKKLNDTFLYLFTQNIMVLYMHETNILYMYDRQTYYVNFIEWCPMLYTCH